MKTHSTTHADWPSIEDEDSVSLTYEESSGRSTYFTIKRCIGSWAGYNSNLFSRVRT